MAKRRWQRAFLQSASIAFLERALAKRRRVAERLQARRDRLAARLADVEAALAAVRGTMAVKRPTAEKAPAAGQARRRRRRGGGRPLLEDAITKVLRGATRPLRAAQVLDRVKAAGYRSQAKDFVRLVYKALGRHPQVARAGRGLYVYKP